MKGNLDVKTLEKWKKADLQKLAEEMGLNTDGTVKELAARIAEEEVEYAEETEREAPDSEIKEKPGDANTVSDKKEIKVRVIQDYKDMLAKQVFRKGAELTVTRERAEELIKAKVVETLS